MVVSLEEAKTYLRVDTDYEDALLINMIIASENLCAKILRVNFNELVEISKTIHMAILYGASFLYENRENADFKELVITLKSLLSGEREDVF